MQTPKVSANQLINKQHENWAFFASDPIYYIWQFYTVASYELTLTIFGVVTVSIIRMVFIPHWSGVLFITPVVSMLYADLMGVLQFAGIATIGIEDINRTSQIGQVTTQGDFVRCSVIVVDEHVKFLGIILLPWFFHTHPQDSYYESK